MHASASAEDATREVALWFDSTDLCHPPSSLDPWLYELPGARIEFDDDDDISKLKIQVKSIKELLGVK